MPTTKLYETDAYQTRFTARVLSCQPVKSGWEAELDQTCFYPEGGGQPCDLGTLGGAAVTQVHEKNGTILHTLTAPVPVGDSVAGELDWQRRFDLMQQHSGEHILSGLIHRAYGCDNVGFHLGADVVTIDFNYPIAPEDLPGLELAANQIVWKNQPTRISYPTAQALEQLSYRSKKALTGQVRIVEFPDADVCACCGTHVARAGEVGQIKLLSCVRFRQGVRLEMLSGARALAYCARILEQNRQVSQLLSAKAAETFAAAQHLAEENAALKYRLTGLENADFQRVAQDLEGRGNVLVFRQDLDADGARRLAIAVQETCGGCAAVFAGEDVSGYKYALGALEGDLRPLVQAMNAALNGRGGGKPGFCQGSLSAARAEIEAFFRG